MAPEQLHNLPWFFSGQLLSLFVFLLKSFVFVFCINVFDAGFVFCCYVLGTDQRIPSLLVSKFTSLQTSVVLCLLKGASNGIQSLLEESLVTAREMLREAQLAYPRSPVRDLNLPMSFLLLVTFCVTFFFFRWGSQNKYSDFPFSVRRSCRAWNPRCLTWPVRCRATWIAILRWVPAGGPPKDLWPHFHLCNGKNQRLLESLKKTKQQKTCKAQTKCVTLSVSIY